MATSIKKLLSIIIVIAGLLIWPAACTPPGDTGEQPSPNPRPASTAETVTPEETAASQLQPGGQTGLTGQVVSASDVSGQPDEPLADQLVLALPVDTAGEILGLPADRLTPDVLRFLKASLPAANPEMVVTRSDAAGKYTLLLDPGEVVLCVADSEQTPPDFPATTRGCGLTTVTAGEQHRVDISSGFGEILLVEQ